MITAGCRFETARLEVAPWHDVDLGERDELADVVTALLSPAVTRWLPPAWGDDLTGGRVQAWMDERDAESTVLLAMDRTSGAPVGLVVLSEQPAPPVGPGRVVVRLGYMVAAQWWGHGFGTELVGGLVSWCGEHPVHTLSGGVDASNVASARVLERNGFQLEGMTEGGEHLWERGFTAH